MHASAADYDKDNVTIHTVHVPAEQVSLHNNGCAQVNTVQSTQFDMTATINGEQINKALDTCAEVSIASSLLWHRLGKPAFKPPPKLRAYGEWEVQALGQCDVEVLYKSQHQRLQHGFVEMCSIRAAVDQRV